MMEYRITARQLRQKYFDFFTRRGHRLVESAPIVPDDDPTALFISAGMQPLVPYIMGRSHPAGRRLVNVQKCFRTSDKYVEIWNDVFMEYERKADGTFAPLGQRTVDTGMGLARVLALLNGLDSVCDIDTLRPLVDQIGRLSGRAYDSQPQSFRIIADHANAACHLAADGVEPANTERGYVLRRLIRRAVVHARRLGVEQSIWASLLTRVQAGAAEIFPELEGRAGQILDLLQGEEE